MKLTQEQVSFIEKYINEDLIDKRVLIEYLEKHRIIKNGIFKRCSKLGKAKYFGSSAYCPSLNSEEGFVPIPRSKFIRRIPFYFFTDKSSDIRRHSFLGPLLFSASGCSEVLESIYLELEWLFYDLDMPIETIFGYPASQLYAPEPKDKKNAINASVFSGALFGESSQIGQTTLFKQWCDYLHLCDQLGWTDYTPERFITKYNYALEAVGREPIIYEPIRQLGGMYFVMGNHEVSCRGHFPCDDNGTPILKWTSLKICTPKTVTFDADCSRNGTLTIGLNPNTTIHFLEPLEDTEADEDGSDEECVREWNQVYAGPLTMSFDSDALRTFRIASGMTQLELATAIEASVRTYQKWEKGETVPDGHNLLRLMNWLQIDSVQHLIKYSFQEDKIVGLSKAKR
ncbi:MAG: helix-turn-helix transcriptional regulator [Bacteroidaceae bacterium]|nr:helix-turn-helix transcriptional regulator [Bacteroidaceae bacterium]